MIVLPQFGFVWLSMPKCASTAVEGVLEPYTRTALPGNRKHTNYLAFQAQVAPRLTLEGYRREDYEVVCLFREPIDWLESWWRYRSRPELRNNPRKRQNWTGDQTFSSFAERYVDRDPSILGLGRQARFLAMEGPDGGIGVDRLFRFESPAVWQDWLVARVGEPLVFRQRNVSKTRAAEIDPSVRRRLEEFLLPEYDIYEHLRTEGQWAPPKGYVPHGRV